MSAGFENSGQELGGGLAVTGNYPGKARTPDELRADLDKTLSLLPGSHRLNLHASYAETGGRKVERDAARARTFPDLDRLGTNPGASAWTSIPTYFAHPLAADGYTLAHADHAIRRFWIDHGIACRQIGAAIGKALGTPCVTNVWIPDGCKDTSHRPQRTARAPRRIARRNLRRAARPAVHPRRRRGQTVRDRLGELCRRLARVLSRLCRDAQEASVPRRRPLSSDRDRLGQDLGGAPVLWMRSCCTSAAAFAGTATTWWSSPTSSRRSLRSWSAAAISTASTSGSIFSTPASTAWPPGSSAPGPCRRHCCSRCSSRPKPSASSRPKAIPPRGWRSWKSSRRSPSARSGIIIACRATCPPAEIGWRRSRHYERDVLSKRG